MSADFPEKPHDAIEFLRQQRIASVIASYRHGLISRVIAHAKLKNEWLFDEKIDALLGKK